MDADQGQHAPPRPDAGGGTNLLTATPDEAALAIACFLLTARDLLCLQPTCGGSPRAKVCRPISPTEQQIIQQIVLDHLLQIIELQELKRAEPRQ